MLDIARAMSALCSWIRSVLARLSGTTEKLSRSDRAPNRMSPHLRPSPRQVVVALVYVLVSAPALYQGWTFGARIGGWPMALVAAINTWLIAVLVVGGLMDSAWRRWQRRRGTEAGAR